MSTGITKPKRHELQNDLTAIAEIPERVQDINIIRLKEILIYIDVEIQNRLELINHLLIHQSGSTFEHWANNVSSVFNYNQLIQLREIIQNHINCKVKFNAKVFKDAPSQRFFEFLFYRFIKIDKTPKTAVQYVFRQFFDTGNSIDLIKMNYKIKRGQMREFAEYYNSFIVDKVPKEKLKDFEITFSLNEPQIKELYRIGYKDQRKERFNPLLLEFQRNNTTVG